MGRGGTRSFRGSVIPGMEGMRGGRLICLSSLAGEAAARAAKRAAARAKGAMVKESEGYTVWTMRDLLSTKDERLRRTCSSEVKRLIEKE